MTTFRLPAFLKSDALTWIERVTGHPRNRWFFVLFFLIPVVGNVISRLTKGRWWLVDFDAVMCAAHTIGRGVSPYNLKPVCEAIRPTPFVYAPQIAEAFRPLDDLFGLMGARWVFALIYAPTMIFLIWYALRKPVENTPWQFRLMTLAAMVGSVLSCGNIGLVLHALAILAALFTARATPRQQALARLPFIAIVLIGGLVKPTFLTYLVVLLLEQRPLMVRIRTFTLAATASIGALLALFLTAGRFSDEWHSAMNAIVILEQPGIGIFATTSALGLATASPVTLIAFLLFAIGFGLATLILAEWGGMTATQRIIFGLGAAQFFNPRLMDYDMFPLAPYMALVVMMAKPLGENTFRWISWAFTGTLVFCVVCNILEIREVHRAPVAVFVYGLITLVMAGLVVWPQRQRILGWFRNPLPVLQDILSQRI